MENIFEKPFLGKYENVPVYLNNGKFGPYLNYNGRLYSVAECFRNEKFNLKTAIKIINYNDKKHEKINQITEKFDKKLNTIGEEIKEVKDCEKDELDTSKPKKEKKEKISK